MRNLITGLAPALAAVALLAAPAPGQDPGPAYSDWNPREIGFPSNAPFSRRANCVRGSDRCIDRTLGEMYRRFHTVVPRCDDNAVFSLTYIRVTEDIRNGLDEGFYDDERWLNHLDALFARPYFLAYDNFRAGRTGLVPPAWRIAFGAGADGEVKGIGNLLLSMNAHVNRDFPFVLYRAGLVDEKGRSRKAEHDSGNQRLRALYKPMLTELSRRFDESIDDYDVPGLVQDDEAFFSLLVDWREAAWRNAQLLAAARTDAERRQVAASIEAYAVSQAELIYAGSAYAPGEDRSAREARCAKHGGQRPGYDRGSDVAHFRAGGPHAVGGGIRAPIVCPDGPGPCAGIASVRGGEGRPLRRRRFELGSGRRGSVTLPLPADDGSLRVRLRSLLEPGLGDSRTRMLQPDPR
jgi:hypothetical protein